ncbi:DNA/RNA non-specific endonuclease [Mucilaginibacter sp. BJC16-A38]|uniref:DNA/RNA non-specific endonuclease n=1 Tax=Mucilaginibacter phenanthrenivorans TaxID=1234842 RepID=UPI00215887BB|nr:DNA/RNA non-specific endonuclease [Mucilaginibacter phenanthrenivorans]MCR8559288.1 DNA/RNA non-specific endonuclease [Mucilaginibacter phenanthrenivorans]
MKRILIGMLLLLGTAHAQDTVSIHHTRFTTTFDKNLHYPVLVHWIVTSNDVCKPHTPRRVERSDSYFRSDPLLADYTRLRNIYENNAGGYQRGHNMDAADNSCNLQQMKECHYFSNITPQTLELNEHTWGDLEDHTRHMVELYGTVEVWCGSFGHKDTMGPVAVPDSCWKIIRYNHTIEAYMFPNTHDVDHNHYDFYQARVSDIRTATHLKLNGI